MSRPSSSYLRSSVLRRRIRSVARCFAVPISQAPGRSGTPEVGHCSSAATRASCASSSAVPMSPTVRVSPAMSRADSIRHIASIARCASAVAVSMAKTSSRALMLGDLTDLEGAAIVWRSLQPLEGLIERSHLPQPVPGHKLLGLGPRSVDDGALLAIEPHALALRARGEAAGPKDDPRLDQLFVELLVVRHSLRRWRGRRIRLCALLCQYQYTHLGLLYWIRFTPFLLGLL